MAFYVRSIADYQLTGRELREVPTKAGEIITGVLHEDGNVALYDGRQRIVLKSGDRIICTRLVNE